MNIHIQVASGARQAGRACWRRLVPAVLVTAVSTAVAQETTPPEPMELETIEVKASPFAKRSADELVQPVDVIAGEELERKRIGNLGDALA